MVGHLENKKKGVTIYDFIFILIFALFTFFVVQSWDHPLANNFLSLAWVLVAIYLIAFSSGMLKNLKLITPTWTLGALISIPIWYLVGFIPLSSSTDLTFDASNALVQLLGVEFYDFATQVFIIVIVETIIIVGLVSSVFLNQTNPKTARVSTFNNNAQKNKKNGLIVVFIAILGAVMHYSVALLLTQQEVSFNFFMLNQVISFFVFAVISLTLGLGAGVSSHMVKNAFAINPYSLISVLLFCVIMDIIAIRTNKNNKFTKSITQKSPLRI